MLCSGEKNFWNFRPTDRYGIRAQGRFWPKRLGLRWAQAGYLGRIGSAGAAVSFNNALEGFFNVLAAARPGGFLTDLTGDF
jgi:hypothetical protein